MPPAKETQSDFVDTDLSANTIAAFLIPSTYDPPETREAITLSDDLYENAAANVDVFRSP